MSEAVSEHCTMPIVAKVQVVPDPNAVGQVAASAPRDLSDSDLSRIAVLINQSVLALQTELQEPAAQAKAFGISEIEMKFGIDLQGESKIPVIGPLLGIGVKAGATFQVTVKLTKSA
jgi:hypothetical protein